MSTIYSVAASLDGFVAGPDDDLDWLLQFGFDAFREHHDRFTAGVGALAMGATTYEWLRGHDDAWPYPDKVTWVFSSRSLDVPADGDVRVVTGDVRGHHGLVMASAGAATSGSSEVACSPLSTSRRGCSTSSTSR